MGGAWRWLSSIQRTFIKSSCKTQAGLDVDCSSNTNIIMIHNASEDVSEMIDDEPAMAEEDLAATMIQAHFRGHLARRAYRALRSLVRVQAVVRGVCVRRQARLASHCMQALVRLHLRVRARQLLNSSARPELL